MVVGKPSSILNDHIVSHHNTRRDRMIIVGDRLHTVLALSGPVLILFPPS